MQPSRRFIDQWPVYYLRRYPAVLAANGFNPRRVAEIPRDAVRQALRLGYLRWTRALARWSRGKDVIDVGCGMGLHGIGFLLEGAKTYLGIDPDVKVRSPVVKDQYSGRRVDCRWTPETLMAACPRFEMVRGRSDELEGKRWFDLAAMHNATEHLTELDAVLASVHRLLRPGGLLVFNHHNWCAWNGHHQQPKTIDRIKPGDADQDRYIDWAHLSTPHAPDSYVMTKLNRLKLDEVRAITAKCFDIEIWRPTASTPDQGASRLTPAIRARHPELTGADFTTQNVFVVARRRDAVPESP
jgi:SAM-dependent methyltransferase